MTKGEKGADGFLHDLSSEEGAELNY